LSDLFQAHPAAFHSAIFILGLAVGSFLNVVAWRLPKMMERAWRKDCRTLLELPAEPAENETFNLVFPRSRCPHCNKPVGALENIPLLSWALLRGRCSSCGKPISIRYPIIELLTGLLSLAVAARFGIGMELPFALLLTWVLIALAVIDVDTQLLPDDITLPVLWIGLLGSLLFAPFTDAASALIGAAAGYLCLWIVYQIFRLLTGKEGMGYGDFKLLAMLGAWLGWKMLPLIVLASSLCGALVGVGLILFRSHERSAPIPFGPYLAIAGWIALMWGPELTAAWLRWSPGSP
jgi:leader peptidase (prepilin peptidase)/N-methyltransferase